MKRLFLTVLFIFILTSLSFADEGSFIICDITNRNLEYDTHHNMIHLSCGKEIHHSLSINVFDPCTLLVDKTFNTDGEIVKTYRMSDGASLLMLWFEIRNGPPTEYSKLIEYDYLTGQVIRTLNLNEWATSMVVNPAETYAFIALGLWSPRQPGTLIKVSLSSFQIVEETSFGGFIYSTAFTPDGSKLYISASNIYPAHHTLPISGVGIFDATNLDILSRIALPTAPDAIVLSEDGSELYIASTNSLDHADRHRGAGLYIVCTQTDEISEKLRFFHAGSEIGTSSLAYDADNNKLYGSVRLDPIPDYPPPSNMIIQIDLNDYSYNFFEMGEEPIGIIALAQTADGPRLFAAEQCTPVVHYKDVKCLFNQDPICVLEVVTPMPYQGSLPAAITFDASNSYDPDGHEVTYHWDFNGDGIFDGVGDEYTGDPWNPTHQFMSYGIHVVMLKVMDECGGECVETVIIEIGEG